MDRNKSELSGGVVNLLKPILRLWQSKMKEKVSYLCICAASLRKYIQSAGLF